MQETRNSCFGSKKHSTTLLQAKTGKHKCWNVKATDCCYISALVLICFRLKKSRDTFFWPGTIVESFLHLMVLIFKVVLNHTTPYIFHKRDFKGKKHVSPICLCTVRKKWGIIKFLVNILDDLKCFCDRM